MRPLGDEGDACHSKKCALAIVVIRRESLRSDHATEARRSVCAKRDHAAEARRSVCAKRDHATDSFAKASRCLPLQVAFGANAPTTLPLEACISEMRYRFISSSGRVWRKRSYYTPS